ncbi:hypothetical protein [Fusobacterium hominis]|uniref:hypothetical protein n=1 Tax=Fusobacterium hominis TaxID=2764326 RepID=UPI0022E33BB6|nr:hypothetical protein [Fusobacterium hominis]
MTKETIILIAITIVAFVILFLLYKYRKEYLNVLAYYAVVQAEQLYKSGEGQKKLEYAVNYIKSRLPWWLSWLISINAIKNIIEKVLANLQATFKAAKEKQLAIIDNIRTYGVNETRLNKLQTEINSNGYVEGYLEARTDLKGNNNIIGGIRAGAKF